MGDRSIMEDLVKARNLGEDEMFGELVTACKVMAKKGETTYRHHFMLGELPATFAPLLDRLSCRLNAAGVQATWKEFASGAVVNIRWKYPKRPYGDS